jgi:hypothetical protein
MKAAFVGTPVAKFVGLVNTVFPVVKFVVKVVVNELWNVPDIEMPEAALTP